MHFLIIIISFTFFDIILHINICQHFNSVRTYFSDELTDDGNYNFLSDGQQFKKYCRNNSCDNNLEKINSACLQLFDAFFGNHNSFKDNAKNNIDVVYYIIIWLSHMLSLKQDNGINKLNDFYIDHIETNTHYKNKIYGVSAYNYYKDIIDRKKDLLNMNNNIISNFYKAFKSLCEMYSVFDGRTSNCKKISSKDANKFVEKYKELNGDSNNTDNSPYRKILSTLLDDYNNLKNKCNDAQDSNFSTFPEISTPQIATKGPEQRSEQNSNVTSSNSSIVSKLIPVLSIFGAISIFLGISYKVNNKELKNYFH
ncbi:putative yir4 protein [Plasmodium yoelii yoelii]|uniref:Yir4 protein n=1 Tax=Plasmodium yoelii yoelii TaxID=73239 RepID=Q7R8T6_PLAYO|nr:putative yir4 protein [Plasmodium yoelii yoelii]